MYLYEIEDHFKWYYEKGYITSRDGNACYKLEDNRFLVTPSGIKKQLLNCRDFVEVDSKGKSKDKTIKVSIETGAHIGALKKTKKKCSVHVHPPRTVALFEKYLRLGISISVLEQELSTEWPELFRYTKLGKTVPFLQPGSKELHKSIISSFKNNVDIVVLHQHGVIAVGDTFEECREHIERLEHLSSIILDCI